MTRREHSIDLPDLAGRRAIVTGASDGIGLGIATALAAAGAEIVMPVRNPVKGEAAAARIRGEVAGARVELARMDLSSLSSVADFAETQLAGGAPVHLLVNNAGVMTPPDRQLTSDGFELQFGTNHLGHVALAARLMPLLRAGGARVVWQTSVAAKRGSINWDDLAWERHYDGMAAYRQSKIAVGLVGLELSRRSAAEGWGVTSAISHPGVAPTSLLAARSEIGRSRDTIGVRMIRRLSSWGVLVGTPHSAGLPALLAATAADADGRFFGPQGPGDTGGAPGESTLWGPLAKPDDARRLWGVSEELTGVRFD